MKKTTKRSILTAAMLFLCLLGLNAQSVVHNNAWYEQSRFNYTWTDANGASHVAKLTDIATDPRQIVALLKKVYCDPNIPGIKYSGYTSSGSRYRSVTYDAIAGGWGISSSDVSTPIEEGYTTLMVALKNYTTTISNSISTYAQLVNYIDYNVESVQLLTNGMRIGSGSNRGTVFNISGNYNRFFFLGKGRATPNWGGAPFLKMFEEFSPTSPSGGETADFYSKMVAGETYNVIHDCPSVINLTHYFSMTGKNGTEKRSMTGLNFFVPDYRFYNVSNTTQVYNTAYSPKVGLYTIKLSASAKVAADPSTCDVTLTWTSSLDQMAKETVPQNYTVYVVLTDESGNETYQLLNVTPNPTGATTLTYNVPRDDHSYTINYIISGTPSDENYSNFFTWSNTAYVVIPGFSAEEIITLGLDHYESDYKLDVERNYYRNVLTVKNENIVYGITPSMITAGHNKYDIYRYEPSGANSVVAHLTFSVSGSTVRYNVTYEGQEILPGFSLSTLGIATSGSLGTYASNAIINTNSIKICDQFSAETNDNTHPGRYEYILYENTDGNPIYSNSVIVPIFKTVSTIDGCYTYDQIINDIDATLSPNLLNTNVEMQLSSNPGIYYYTLMRGVNDEPSTIISKLQHRTDGSYLEMLDVLPQYTGQVIDMGSETTKIVDRLDNNYVSGNAGDFASYLPILWIFGNDRMKHDGESSYGSPIWETGVGEVIIDATDNWQSADYGEWYDEAGNDCAVFNPYITLIGNVPEVEGVNYEPFMYRVWRISDDIRGYSIDPVTGDFLNDQNAPRDPRKLIVEDQTNNDYVTYGTNNELVFGAKSDATVKFLVRFYYVKEGQAGSDKPMFYVVENMLTWGEGGTSTGIDKIGANEIVSKTYYNSLGIASSEPYNGINIVVTRYSNGTTRTAKIVR